MVVEVYKYFFVLDELEDEVSLLFGIEVLVVSYSWLESQVGLASWGNQGEMDVIFHKVLSFFDLDEETSGLELFTLEFYVAIGGPIGFINLTFLRIFLIQNKQIQLIIRSNKIERNVFLLRNFELEGQRCLLIIKKIGKRDIILELNILSILIQDSQSHFSIIQSKYFKDQLIILSGLIERWMMISKHLFIAFVGIKSTALIFRGTIDDHIGSIDY